MSDWLSELQILAAKGETAVLVTVAGTRGSTPREIGAKMLVTANSTLGTIGGGQLEYLCIQEACGWLAKIGSNHDGSRTTLRKFTLGAGCGQCCGGVVDVLFEEVSPTQNGWVDKLSTLRNSGVSATMVTARQSRLSALKCIVTSDSLYTYGGEQPACQSMVDSARNVLRSRSGASANVVRRANNVELPVLIEPVHESSFRVVIFGAGHVGGACATVLSMLDTRVFLVDSRKNFLNGQMPDNIRAVETADPAGFVAAAPPNSYFLVMTHDHGLDQEICSQILQRPDVAFCGLIGSRSKRHRFIKRFRELGLTEAEIARLTCPIGLEDICGKKPAEIAVSVAAQLQSLHESRSRTDVLTHHPIHAIRS